MLLVAPGFGFAEREHAAVIAVLPMLAVLAMRAEGRPVAVALALLAGAGGGVVLAFKPHYGLAIGLAALVAVVARRGVVRVIGPEFIATAAVSGLYLAALFALFPNYVRDVLPVALHVYAAARNDLGTVIPTPLFAGTVGMLVVVLVAARRLAAPARVAVIAGASAGFLITFVIQAKGWFNHAYPGLALAVLAGCVLLTARPAADARTARLRRLFVMPALICVPFFGAVGMNVPGAEEYPGLAAALRAHAPVRPRIATLAEQLDLGHPIVRQLDGIWIGRQNALWITDCVNHILATTSLSADGRARLEAFRER